MTTETKRPGAHKFVALQIEIEIAWSLRGVLVDVRRHSRGHADQIARSAASIAANLGEGNRRVKNDRLHFFRIASGSAEETRQHLLVAVAYGWIRENDVAASLD